MTGEKQNIDESSDRIGDPENETSLKFNDLLDQLESMRCENEKLKHENAYLVSTEHLLESKCAALDSHVEEAQTQILEYKEKLHSLMAHDAKENENRCKYITAQSPNATKGKIEKGKKTQQMEVISSREEDLMSALEAQLRATAYQCEENDILKHNMSELQTLCEKLEDHNAELKAENRKMLFLRDEIKELKEKNQQLNEKLKINEIEFSKGRSENASLTEKLSQAETHIDLLKESTKEMDRLRHEIETIKQREISLLDKISHINQERDQLRRHLSECRFKCGESDKLQIELKIARATIEDLKLALQKAEILYTTEQGKIEEVRSSLVSSKNNADELLQQFTLEKEKVKSLIQERDTLQEKVSILTEELNDSKVKTQIAEKVAKSLEETFEKNMLVTSNFSANHMRTLELESQTKLLRQEVAKVMATTPRRQIVSSRLDIGSENAIRSLSRSEGLFRQAQDRISNQRRNLQNDQSQYHTDYTSTRTISSPRLNLSQLF